MKIKEAFERVDKGDKNHSDVNLSGLASAIGLDIYQLADIDYEELENPIITCYTLINWLCTDMWVGFDLYFINDKPLAMSECMCRKCEMKYYIVEDAIPELRDHIFDLVASNEDYEYEACDMDEEINQGYRIGYLNQVLNWDRMTYKDIPVELVKKYDDESGYGIATKIRIKTKDGDELDVYMNDVRFGYHLNKK